MKNFTILYKNSLLNKKIIYKYVVNTLFFIGVSYGIFVLFFTLYSIFDPSVLVDSFQFHITPLEDRRPWMAHSSIYGYCNWNSHIDTTRVEIKDSILDFKAIWMGCHRDISYDDFLRRWDKDPTFREIVNCNFNKLRVRILWESENWAQFERKMGLYLDLSKVGLTLNQQGNFVLIKKIP